MGIKVLRRDAEKLRLTDRLLQAVLAEAQVVCASQACAYCWGILTLILQSYPVWPKGISAGRYVDLALAHSLGAGCYAW